MRPEYTQYKKIKKLLLIFDFLKINFYLNYQAK